MFPSAGLLRTMALPVDGMRQPVTSGPLHISQLFPVRITVPPPRSIFFLTSQILSVSVRFRPWMITSPCPSATYFLTFFLKCPSMSLGPGSMSKTQRGSTLVHLTTTFRQIGRLGTPHHPPLSCSSVSSSSSRILVSCRFGDRSHC
jgi:hypothetical protein